MTAHVTTSDGTRLCWEAHGRADAPALLLLGGATWSMDWWEDGLVERLAAADRRVVRHDPRDTGGSTSWPAGQPTYGAEDMVADALAVAAAAGVADDRPLHVVGFSMGGGLAQRLAARHPDRVATLTLVSTSSADRALEGLAPPTDALMATFAEEGPDPDWSDADAVVEHLLAAERPFAGPADGDEERLRALLHRVVARTPDPSASQVNHVVVAEQEAPPVRLADLAGVPTLVVHGDADPLFPGHGAVLARALGATYVELPGVGHELAPPALWPLLVDALVDHTAR